MNAGTSIAKLVCQKRLSLEGRNSPEESACLLLHMHVLHIIFQDLVMQCSYWARTGLYKSLKCNQMFTVTVRHDPRTTNLVIWGCLMSDLFYSQMQMTKWVNLLRSSVCSVIHQSICFQNYIKFIERTKRKANDKLLNENKGMKE